jgi:hypothetical protein
MLHAERKIDRITSIKQEKPKPSLQPAGPIKRPQQPGAHGGRRGGLGLKRATAHGPSDKATPDNDKMDTTADSKDGDGGKSKKSNDDFRAMLQQNRTA